MLTPYTKSKGFTLIEVLVVIGLIAVLAAITIVAINPAKNFADARNTQRSANTNQILNAITQYTSESGHALADFGTIPTCPSTTNIGTGTGNINLKTLLVDTYIADIPFDPGGSNGTVGTAANTKYTMCQTTTGRVTVAAPQAENGKTISVSR